ncbi:MAG: hypothetical protein E7450_08065 [Ruminococcaceae bacterium]|nr:hypothetical protein [Oscillospiraceae bacterium]
MNNIPDYVRPGGKSYVSPEGIIYCTDGNMRWAYELDQCSRPAKLLSLLRRWIAVGAVAGVLVLGLRVATDGMAGLLSGLLVLLGLIGAGAVLALVLFGVHLLQKGRVVCLLFTLGEETVSCQQVKGTANKEKVTHEFAVWVGGQSQPALQFCELRQAELRSVRAIGADQVRHSIRLRGAKGLQTLLLEPQQFQPVLSYLQEHCPNVN